MSEQPNWIPDPEWHAANRAEKAVVGEYELVVFDVPESDTQRRIIGWEVFGGPNLLTQLATDETDAITNPDKQFDAAKAAAEKYWRNLISDPTQRASQPGRV